MAHKKKNNQNAENAPYTLKDAMTVTEDIFKLSKEKKYSPGAFVHGLVFAIEYTQQSFNIPQQQLADIKRNCRRFVKETANYRKPID